jgi:hypothetical protein
MKRIIGVSLNAGMDKMYSFNEKSQAINLQNNSMTKNLTANIPKNKNF